MITIIRYLRMRVPLIRAMSTGLSQTQKNLSGHLKQKT